MQVERLRVVADGTGSNQASKVASEIIVSTIRNACTLARIGAHDSNLALPYLSEFVKAVGDARSAIC